MTLNLPPHFFRYLGLVLVFFFLGIAVIVLQGMAAYPGLAPLNATELQSRYDYHVANVIPFMDSVFLRLVFLNGGVALFVVVVPQFWAWVWWFRCDILEPLLVIMKGTVILLMLALGHNSFLRLYISYKTLPPGIFATMYLPHGIPEILAFVAAGVFSFFCIDSLGDFLRRNADAPDLHPGDIGLFIFNRIWRGVLIILAVLVIAAFIESRVTPLMVKAAYEAALSAG